MKFTEECTMCIEKHVLVKIIFTNKCCLIVYFFFFNPDDLKDL